MAGAGTPLVAVVTHRPDVSRRSVVHSRRSIRPLGAVKRRQLAEQHGPVISLSRTRIQRRLGKKFFPVSVTQLTVVGSAAKEGTDFPNIFLMFLVGFTEMEKERNHVSFIIMCLLLFWSYAGACSWTGN